MLKWLKLMTMYPEPWQHSSLGNQAADILIKRSFGPFVVACDNLQMHGCCNSFSTI